MNEELDSYFYNDFRHSQWQEALKTDEVWLDHKGNEKKFGTVGAVALDIHGNLAAATSTGGMTNKKFGRIGDSPLIGCGTYASNLTAAVSCTGHGEFFIRKVVAHRVCDLMELKGLSLSDAAYSVVMDELAPIGGEGGLIALDLNGRPVFAFNSEGMYRGWVDERAEIKTAIYSNED
jgi:beta-aspartyl-peptidase (threonine type)